MTRGRIGKYSFKEEGTQMNGGNGISFKELFSKDIDRNINGVIKANDEKNLNDEVNEYVLTEEICRNLAKFLDA